MSASSIVPSISHETASTTSSCGDGVSNSDVAGGVAWGVRGVGGVGGGDIGAMNKVGRSRRTLGAGFDFDHLLTSGSIIQNPSPINPATDKRTMMTDDHCAASICEGRKGSGRP